MVLVNSLFFYHSSFLLSVCVYAFVECAHHILEERRREYLECVFNYLTKSRLGEKNKSEDRETPKADELHPGSKHRK